MGFTPSTADPDVWMCKNGNTYENIVTYVDDLAICMKDPTEVTNALQEKYGYKLKGVGPITYTLVGITSVTPMEPSTQVQSPTSTR